MFEGVSAGVDRLMSRKQAAIYFTQLGLPISAQTLAHKFSNGSGPLCIHVGRRAMYRESDLIQYFRQQASAPRRSSSEPIRPAALDDLPIPPTCTRN